MGIKGLAKLLSDEAPDCIREVELKSLHGRKVAIDGECRCGCFAQDSHMSNDAQVLASSSSFLNFICMSRVTSIA